MDDSLIKKETRRNTLNAHRVACLALCLLLPAKILDFRAMFIFLFFLLPAEIDVYIWTLVISKGRAKFWLGMGYSLCPL